MKSLPLSIPHIKKRGSSLGWKDCVKNGVIKLYSGNSFNLRIDINSDKDLRDKESK